MSFQWAIVFIHLKCVIYLTNWIALNALCWLLPCVSFYIYFHMIQKTRHIKMNAYIFYHNSTDSYDIRGICVPWPAIVLTTPHFGCESRQSKKRKNCKTKALIYHFSLEKYSDCHGLWLPMSSLIVSAPLIITIIANNCQAKQQRKFRAKWCLYYLQHRR